MLDHEWSGWFGFLLLLWLVLPEILPYEVNLDVWLSGAFRKAIKTLIHSTDSGAKNWLTMQSHKFQTPHPVEALLRPKQLDSGEGGNPIVGRGVL